jgi:hypothetical protein
MATFRVTGYASASFMGDGWGSQNQVGGSFELANQLKLVRAEQEVLSRDERQGD